jgi:hypothetical protein
VKISNVGNIVRGDKNMIEINGYDLTNNKGFKKAFFETKRDGGRTKNADISDGLIPGDFIEITMDDTTWKNIQFIKKIAEPAGGAAAPMSAPAGSGNPTGGGSSERMSKAEWALKDAKKELSMARHKAIEASAIIAGGKGISKATVESIEKLADRFTAYILTGDFNGEPDLLVQAVSTTAETPAPSETPNTEQNPVPSSDDDIPF